MMNKFMKKLAVALTVATMAITATSAMVSANETKYVANEIGVNVRQRPDANSARLGGLNKGDAVDVIGTAENGFVKINFNGQVAYVVDALSYTKPATQPVQEAYSYASGITADGQIQTNNAGTPSYVMTDENYATKENYTVSVNGYLALRSDPAFNYANEIAQLHTGDQVQFRENYGTYWCVYVPATGMLGFVNSNYLV